MRLPVEQNPRAERPGERGGDLTGFPIRPPKARRTDVNGHRQQSNRGASLCGRTIQSGSRTRNGKGQGNAWLRGYLGQAAIAAARTNTFPGERYRRIARHRGAARAQVAVARSILIIVWHLLSDPTARYHDLGPGHYQARTDKNRKARNHIRQLEALGYTVSITQAA